MRNSSAANGALLFDNIDAPLAILQGYFGVITAFLGVWAIFTSDWTALGWAALFLRAALGKRSLNDNHLLAQAWALWAAVLIRCEEVNCHFDVQYPHHVPARLITLPLLAAAFYLAAWVLSGVKDLRVYLRLLALWSGTCLLAALVWLDVSQPWVAPVWVAFGGGARSHRAAPRIAEFCYQEHALAAAAVAQLAAINIDAPAAIDRYLPFVGCAAAFYAISRFSTVKEATYARFAGWAHTWAATALLAALAWHESPQPWLAVIWAVFALALAFVDRIFSVEELPWQAHVLALLAVIRAVTLNLYLHDKWRGIDLRLLTVSILVAVLYALARWVRLPESLRASEARHAYTWVASVLAAWLLWGELRPVGLAVGWLSSGCYSSRSPPWKQLRQIRWQALRCARGRIRPHLLCESDRRKRCPAKRSARVSIPLFPWC